MKAKAPVRGQEGALRLQYGRRPFFGGAPDTGYKGSDEVRVANQRLARDARKAERAWRRSLQVAA